MCTFQGFPQVLRTFFLEGGSSKFDLGVGMGGGDLSQYMGGALGAYNEDENYLWMSSSASKVAGYKVSFC